MDSPGFEPGASCYSASKLGLPIDENHQVFKLFSNLLLSPRLK